MNKNLLVTTLSLLLSPTLAGTMESKPLLSALRTQSTESLGSLHSVHSPSSSSQSSTGTPITVTIERTNARESFLSPQELETVPRAQKSLLKAYAIGAGAIVIFLTGCSVGKSGCNP